ncbi:hypothetical protein MOQ_010044 [Trypanosoma cruzi marinkellei]|uniref:Uncharacterized protein n=1 Tax=Trypanosoma cruzi marinkellei TaxID=85056 RepID=K2MKM4_TRYCR|nr:hypothetical protein MOQ_010044 [Trypanosoma cruzi marinkellei]
MSGHLNCEHDRKGLNATQANMFFSFQTSEDDSSTCIQNNSIHSSNTNIGDNFGSCHQDSLMTIQRALYAADCLASVSAAAASTWSGEYLKRETTSSTSNSGSDDACTVAAYLQVIFSAIVSVAESQQIDLECAVRCCIRSLALEEELLRRDAPLTCHSFPASAGTGSVESNRAHHADDDKHSHQGHVKEGKQQPQPQSQSQEQQQLVPGFQMGCKGDKDEFPAEKKGVMGQMKDDASINVRAGQMHSGVRMDLSLDGVNDERRDQVEDPNVKVIPICDNDPLSPLVYGATAFADIASAPRSTSPPRPIATIPMGEESYSLLAPPSCVAGMSSKEMSRSGSPGNVAGRHTQEPHPRQIQEAMTVGVKSSNEMSTLHASNAFASHFPPQRRTERSGHEEEEKEVEGVVEQQQQQSSKSCLEAIMPTEPPQEPICHRTRHATGVSNKETTSVDAPDAFEKEGNVASCSVASVAGGPNGYAAATPAAAAAAVGNSVMEEKWLSAESSLEKGCFSSEGIEGKTVVFPPTTECVPSLLVMDDSLGAFDTTNRVQEENPHASSDVSLSTTAPKTSGSPPFPKMTSSFFIYSNTELPTGESLHFTTDNTVASLRVDVKNDKDKLSASGNVVSSNTTDPLHQDVETASPSFAKPHSSRAEEASVSSWALPLDVTGVGSEEHVREKEGDTVDVSWKESKISIDIPTTVTNPVTINSITSPLLQPNRFYYQQQQQQQSDVSVGSAATVTVSPFLPCEESSPSFRWMDDVVVVAPMTMTTAATTTTATLRSMLPFSEVSAESTIQRMDENEKRDVGILSNVGPGEFVGRTSTEEMSLPLKNDGCLLNLSHADGEGGDATRTSTPSATPAVEPSKLPRQDSHAISNHATVRSECSRSPGSDGSMFEKNFKHIRQSVMARVRREESSQIPSLREDSCQDNESNETMVPYGLLLLQQLLYER